MLFRLTPSPPLPLIVAPPPHPDPPNMKYPIMWWIIICREYLTLGRGGGFNVTGKGIMGFRDHIHMRHDGVQN